MSMVATEVTALLAGRVLPFGDGKTSAIAKTRMDRVAMITTLGIAGDEQADLVHHGGPDKALHHYPADHYPWWRRRLGDKPLLNVGGFGENISTFGLTENDVCLGDRFRLGGALIEVSHARKPCWKLAERFGLASMVGDVTTSGRAGWYYRVIEEGKAQEGDRLEMVGRVLPDWSMARLFSLLVAGGYRKPGARQELVWLADQPLLAEAWRQRARDLMGFGFR